MQGRAAVLVLVVNGVCPVLQDEFHGLQRALLSRHVRHGPAQRVAKEGAVVVEHQLQAVIVVPVDGLAEGGR